MKLGQKLAKFHFERGQKLAKPSKFGGIKSVSAHYFKYFLFFSWETELSIHFFNLIIIQKKTVIDWNFMILSKYLLIFVHSRRRSMDKGTF